VPGAEIIPSGDAPSRRARRRGGRPCLGGSYPLFLSRSASRGPGSFIVSRTRKSCFAAYSPPPFCGICGKSLLNDGRDLSSIVLYIKNTSPGRGHKIPIFFSPFSKELNYVNIIAPAQNLSSLKTPSALFPKVNVFTRSYKYVNKENPWLFNKIILKQSLRRCCCRIPYPSY
jgi:hypothetical protein